MKIDDLLKLKDAGFTSEEIASLSGVLDKEETQQIQAPELPEFPDYSAKFEELKNDIMNEMKSLFMNAPQGTDVKAQESVDDILKMVIGGK